MDPATDVGTVIDERAAKLVRGARQRCGREGREAAARQRPQGRALSADRASTTCRYDCELVREETFGPVIPIIRCPDDIDEAIRISNSTAYGLSSGVCTNRLDYITRFVNELEVGTVNVWEVPGYRIEMTPFGGIKDSGLGYKEGVRRGDEELHQRQDLFAAVARLTQDAAKRALPPASDRRVVNPCHSGARRRREPGAHGRA